MRFRRSVASVLLLSTITGSAVLAQSKVSFGVLAGGAFSKFSGQAAKDAGLDKTRVGIAGGVFLSLGLSRNIAFEPEVLYVQKGGKLENSGGTGTFKLDYVEIPGLLKLRFSTKGGLVSPHLYGGGALGFKAGCKITATPTGVSSVTRNCTDPALDVKVKSTDFSLVFGAGVDVGRAMIDVRYDLGLTKIDDTPPQEDTKNRAFYLLVGWAFRSPR